MSRSLRIALGAAALLLVACSGPEPKQADPAPVLAPTVGQGDGPPLGNPRGKLSPHELLEHVDTD